VCTGEDSRGEKPKLKTGKMTGWEPWKSRGAGGTRFDAGSKARFNEKKKKVQTLTNTSAKTPGRWKGVTHMPDAVPKIRAEKGEQAIGPPGGVPTGKK